MLNQAHPDLSRSDLSRSDLSADSLLLAGQCASPGLYREVGTKRLVLLEQADYLPASCDGRVTCYERMGELWGQICRQSGQVRRSAGKSVEGGKEQVVEEKSVEGKAGTP